MMDYGRIKADEAMSQNQIDKILEAIGELKDEITDLKGQLKWRVEPICEEFQTSCKERHKKLDKLGWQRDTTIAVIVFISTIVANLLRVFF